jgi:hypothetical protein
VVFWVVAPCNLVDVFWSFEAFYGLEGLLPCSQQPATRHYPEPDESNQHPIFLLFSRLHLNLSSGFFPIYVFHFPTKTYAILIYPMHDTRPVNVFLLILWPWNIWWTVEVMTTNIFVLCNLSIQLCAYYSKAFIIGLNLAPSFTILGIFNELILSYVR